MIEIRNLSKRFGAFTAVDDVSFQVQPGEVLGFLGPNGAGKSTTMKMITGFLAASQGSVEVCGSNVEQDPRAVKARIGYLPEGAPLYPDMTPESLLHFVGEMRGLSGAKLKARIQEVVDLVHLEGVRHQRIETLSKGFKRRVGLAQAIVHDPEVLILDEPTDGLDPNQKHEVRTLIRDMAAGKVIVLSTHILEEVESVCTRAIIIAKGRMCFDGTPAELRKRSAYFNAVALTVKTDQDISGSLTALAGVARVEETGSADGHKSYMLFPADGQAILRAVGDHAHEAGLEVEHLHVEKGRLDEVFRTITQEEAGASAPAK